MSTFRLAVALGWLAASLELLALPQKIACIGDSITEGAGLSNPSKESYPAKLGSLLGTNATVRNFGVSGRTLLKKGDYPYWKEAMFKASHDFEPDVVIIQLGTNDAKPYNWRYGTNFVSDYEELISSYAILTNKPKIYVCTPCPVYGNGAYDIRPGTIATNIAPAIRDIAARLGLDLIDLQTRLAGHAEWLPDTVHPNSKGMTVMAAVMYSALADDVTNEPLPALDVQRLTLNKVVVSWPASWRGMVPQSITALRGTNTDWGIAETVINLDGSMVRQTNTLISATRTVLYRLWQP